MKQHQLRHCESRNVGFTLIELSVSLVIIGLVVGGVMLGSELIHAAKIRTVISTQEKYVTAINTFRFKYNALPGDIPNATIFWGTLGGGCPGSYVIGSPLTCDGNGDQLITPTFALPDFYEQYRFWQHLSNSGLIAGQFSGVSTVPGGGNTANLGADVPQFNLGASAWMVGNTSYWGAGATPVSPTGGGNFLYTGSAINLYPAGSFTVMEAWQIDSKIDDGGPLPGK